MTQPHQFLHPRDWKQPKGFANGIVAEGRLVFLAGQVGWNAEQKFDSEDFVAQVRQALANIVTLVAEAGGRPEHITRLTWFVIDKKEYLSRLARTGPGLPQRHGQALSGHDAGAGRGAGRGQGQSRNRSDSRGARLKRLPRGGSPTRVQIFLDASRRSLGVSAAAAHHRACQLP